MRLSRVRRTHNTLLDWVEESLFEFKANGVLNLTIDVEYGSLAFVEFKVKTNFEITFIDHINLKHLNFLVRD
jgi:hypothetical protein